MDTLIKLIVNNRKLIAAGFVLILIGFLLSLLHCNRMLREDNRRLENNQIALSVEAEAYKTKSGRQAIRINELELTSGEFEKMCEEQAQTIKDMGLKIKRLEMASTTGINTVVNKKIYIRDTTYIEKVDTMYIEKKMKRFDWNDDWNSISGVIYNDSVECLYKGNDTLTIAAIRVPKKFLFFRWGTKYIQINAVNANPSTSITYNKTIKIKK